MSILRKASQETVKLFLGEDKADFIEVLADISKRQFNAIVGSMPGKVGDEVRDMSIHEATEFQKVLFQTFVVGWSLDEDASVDAYEALTSDAGNAIDSALAEHFSSLSPSKQESK